MIRNQKKALTIMDKRRGWPIIDIHNHILPGLDDGPSTIHESIQLLKNARNQGITTVVASPHHLTSHYENSKEVILLKKRLLEEALKKENIDITIRATQEIRLSEDILTDIENDRLLPLTDINGEKHILLELPFQVIPMYLFHMLTILHDKNYKIILVHPERYEFLRKDHTLFQKICDFGVNLQINAGSLFGKHGRSAKKFAWKLLNEDAVTFIASDAHNLKNRPFFLEKAYKKIGKRIGMNTVTTLKKNAVIFDFNYSGQVLY